MVILIKLTFFIALLYPINCFSSEIGNNKIINKVPKGFENLEEDGPIMIDLFFGGRFVTNDFANIDGDYIELSNPRKIINLIKNINNRDIIVESLSKKLKKNSEFSCFPVVQPNCGEIKDLKIAQIIYSPNKFRADIVINDKFFKISKNKKKYISSSQEGISTITSFNNIINGNSLDDEINYSLNTSNIVSYKNFSITASHNYSKGSKNIL